MKIELGENDYNTIINLIKLNYKISEIIDRLNENPRDLNTLKEMTLTINEIKKFDKEKLLYLIKVFESVRK
jgi:hypothetical protein